METLNPQTNHQVLIKLLNGKHKTLNYTSSILPIQTLKHQIHALTSIPPPLQLLTLPTSRLLDESASITLPDTSSFPLILHLSARLRGGKGGFGSLLRGAATKAGQKKTNNFDACRDMSGRRLRHVNAEKKLEEWRAEADERKLEKVAEEYLKKKEKEVGAKRRKSGKGEDAERYVAKYREDSAKCMEEVERTVRESLRGVLKRKGGDVEGDKESDAKRMKIWMGKRLADSDSDDMDDDSEDDEENEKSTVIDNGNNSGSIEEAYRSPDSVSDIQLGSVSSGKVTSDSGSESEMNANPEENPSSGHITDGCEDKTAPNEDVPSLNASVECGSESLKQENVADIDSHNDQPLTVAKKPPTSDLGENVVAQVNGISGSKSAYSETEVLNSGKPLNFDDYSSAAEMEVLGMERLKSELQKHGLKCGGTLQERAARLYLLKTTPLEKLPKKLFAKK